MKTRQAYNARNMIVATVSVVAGILAANAFAERQVIQLDQLTVLVTGQGAVAVGLDYANAKPMPLPQALAEPVSQLDSLLEAQEGKGLGMPGVAKSGNPGSGKLSPVVLVPKGNKVFDAPYEFNTREHGASKLVFTTSRSNAYDNTTTRYYPYRAAGKLWFKVGVGLSVCSAALIKPGVLVTAAHCAANFGKRQYFSGWQFAPGYDNGVAPFGQATVKAVYLASSYYNGTDACFQKGVVCQNDVAVLVLNTNIGKSTGWLTYGWNGYGYANNQAHITQLGYPVALDAGASQQRTDSQGFVISSMSGSSVIGSLQTGGSSGGPWVVNFGMAPTLKGTAFGSNATHNVIVGVTSWGNDTGKQQGTSPFTSNNIATLTNAACAAYPDSC